MKGKNSAIGWAIVIALLIIAYMFLESASSDVQELQNALNMLR